ncbi:MAG: HAD family phosphatase [Bacillales bacterium]|nr:HAD family phosphatase [Bacillales bacterium]
MIRCIASDMDGTLLNSKQKISPANRDAIQFAQNQGVEFVIATGRSYREAKEVLEEAGIRCTVIALNGAEVRNEAGGITHRSVMSAKTASKAADYLENFGVYYEFFTNKGTFTENYETSIDMLVDIFQSANPEVPEEEIRMHVQNRGNNRYIQNMYDSKQIFNDPSIIFYKIVAFDKKESIFEELSSQLQSEVDDIHVTSSGFRNIEINHISAQKGIALERFVKEKGISLQHTMAVGDHLNDLSMLERVGFPIAMGNAVQSVKNLCPYETSKNDEDGVAKAIHTFLEIGQ